MSGIKLSQRQALDSLHRSIHIQRGQAGTYTLQYKKGPQTARQKRKQAGWINKHAKSSPDRRDKWTADNKQFSDFDQHVWQELGRVTDRQANRQNKHKSVLPFQDSLALSYISSSG